MDEGWREEKGKGRKVGGVNKGFTGGTARERRSLRTGSGDDGLMGYGSKRKVVGTASTVGEGARVSKTSTWEPGAGMVELLNM